jgi:hypothetical protein
METPKATDKRTSALSPQEDLAQSQIRQVPLYDIDISPARGDENELLIDGLRDLGLYEQGYGFSVIHPKLLSSVLTCGTYRFEEDGTEKSTVFCLRAQKNDYGEDSLTDGYQQWNDYTDFDRADCRGGVPIVVYDLEKLDRVETAIAPEFRFRCERKLDAVFGVILLKNY